MMTKLSHIPSTDLRPFWDAARGKTGWVLGGGMSILETKPEDFSKEDFIIVVNQQIWCHELLGFPKPAVWLFGDIWVPMNINPKQYPDVSKWACDIAAAYLIGAGYHPADTLNKEVGTGDNFILFSENKHPTAHRLPYTSLNTYKKSLLGAIHIAWLTGCNPINICGMDFGTDKDTGQHYWWEGMGKCEVPSEVIKQACNKSYTESSEWAYFLIQCIRASGIEVNVLSKPKVKEENLKT